MTFDICEKDAGARLDVFVSENTELSRNAAAKLIECGEITVSGKKAVKKYELKVGDRVEVNLPEPELSEIAAENIPLDIIYEDSELLVTEPYSGWHTGNVKTVAVDGEHICTYYAGTKTTTGVFGVILNKSE